MANQPEKRFKCGGCDAYVFENEINKNGNAVKIKKSIFQKRCKDKEGNWQSTNSYDANDLPNLKLVVDEAYRYLALSQGDGAGDLAESGKNG